MIGTFRVPVSSGGSTEEWVRPSDWLAIPEIPIAESGWNGVYAVYDHDSNFASVRFSVTGGYTVDWGDGVVENVASNTKQDHIYDYASISNATISTRGYKQVIIKVYPQNLANHFSTISMQAKHSQAGLQAYATGWLDVKLRTTTTLISIAFGGSTVAHRNIERFELVGNNTITNFNEMFNNCNALQSVPLFNTASGTNFNSMFSSCNSLQSVPFFNTASGTSFSNMFQSCNSLQSVPLFNTASGTNFSSMFSICNSLQSVPFFNTASGTDFTAMFQSCNSLQSVPLFNTASGTFVNSMFNVCPSLSKGALQGINRTISYTSCKLSNIEIGNIFNNLAKALNTSQTITITNNWGSQGIWALNSYSSFTTTAGSTLITRTGTIGNGFVVGAEVVGTGITNAVAVTFTDAGDLVNRTSHGLANGKEVSFATIVSTTGIDTYTIYYVVNATTDDFQLSLTEGGSPIALTTDGSGTIIYQTKIVSINPGVSITVDVPASASGTVSLSLSELHRYRARLKGWLITG